MFYGLVEVTYFDLVTVGFTFTVLVAVQILNALWSLKEKGSVDSPDNCQQRKSVDENVTKLLKINENVTELGNGEATTPLILHKRSPSSPVTTTTAAVTVSHTAATTLPKNGKLQKQQSEQSENLSYFSSTSTIPNASSPFSASSSSSSPTTSSASATSSSSQTPPTLSIRHSMGNLFNGNTGYSLPNFATAITSCYPDNLSDEYHEDEDTISLENLLPCDHTEIYSSRKISYIIDELLQTEGNYINNLKKGLQNYGNLDKYDKLPDSLRGADKQQQLLGNIKEILDLHEKQILPLMLGNQRDLKTMFDEMTSYIDKNQFYCYVTFTMHKQTSMQLRKDNREWFQNYQNEINDRLGIDSFLVQPIQRLTRYPLLLSQFISEFYKSGINCKPVLVSVCKLETRMRRLLEVVNQSEEVLNIEELPSELTIGHFGAFRRSTEFEAYSCRSRKKFKAKVFLFDQFLLCVEIRKRRLAYRNHYSWGSIELKLNSSKSVSLLMKSTHGAGSNGGKEYEFSAPEAISVTQWLRCARKIFENARIEESQRGKFSLPMDLVLGAVFAIWLIWHYLY
ncbi:rho guanine nucleotide exchange factor 25-like [Musca vetustissima]|uniref:rho guanine nucleotide exchange factor 25-like n=1 Tax=Musca vetustissima TaxID=27455 RepID=UPI002AB6E928|nr:rho guanine nucleotide exchange factor 25-like [Musca vetustissima]